MLPGPENEVGFIENAFLGLAPYAGLNCGKNCVSSAANTSLACRSANSAAAISGWFSIASLTNALICLE